jgi:solute carrier family 10 (sodium/bile acid cotransporter), member 7
MIPRLSMRALRGHVGHCWFYIALVIVFLIGWDVPAVGAWMKAANSTRYLVAIAFLVNGLSLPSTLLVGTLRRWPALIAAVFIVFAVAPALVYGMRLVLPGSGTPLAMGFQFLAAVPTTLVTAVVLTRLAGGNSALALYITLLTNLLAVLVVPALMALTLGNAVHLDIVGTTLNLALIVVAPTLAGQLIRRAALAWADRHAHTFGLVSQGTVLLFLVTGLAELPRGQVSVAIGAVALAFALMLHLAMLAAGDLAGRVLREEEPTRMALLFSSAQKSLVLSVYLYAQLFGGRPGFGLAVLPAIAYYLIELSLDSGIAQWWGRGRIQEGSAFTVCES